MLTRNILILCSMALILVDADLEAVDEGAQAMFATDHDSTSDEAPTESLNLVSPDLTNDELLYYNGAAADASSSAEAGNSAPQVNNVPKADAAKSSMEDHDEDEAPDSEEAAAVKPPPVPVQRATKSHNATARKRGKPASASKKRSRNLRP